MADSAATTLRTCIKTGCRWPAVASLSYRHCSREVWLLDLSPEPNPAEYDLCPHHADHLVVPRGWTLLDDRNPIVPRREPSATEIVERANAARLRAQRAQRAHQARPPRVNRYAELLAQLDELAQSSAVATLEADEDWREHGWSEDHHTREQVGPVLNAVERANRIAAHAHDGLSQEGLGDELGEGVDGGATDGRGQILADPDLDHPRDPVQAAIDQKALNQRELIEERLHELLDRIGAKPRLDHPSQVRDQDPAPVRPHIVETQDPGLAPVVPLFALEEYTQQPGQPGDDNGDPAGA